MIAEFLILCENLRYLRAKKGLSKKEMAAKLNISIKDLTLLENNEAPNRLSSDLLFNIKKEFNINPNEMFMLLY